MNQLGSVIVFKPCVGREEAAKALESIADVLEVPERSFDMVPVGDPNDRRVNMYGNVVVQRSLKERPFEFGDYLNEFDPSWGGPTWYIP
jgi:hypothetical protein